MAQADSSSGHGHAVGQAGEPAGDDGTLAQPASAPATPNVVDDRAWWVVPGTTQQVVQYVESHPPPGAKPGFSGTSSGGGKPTVTTTGFQWPAIPGELSLRWLLVAAVQLQDGSTAVRADSEVVRITPRPRSERTSSCSPPGPPTRTCSGCRPSASRTPRTGRSRRQTRDDQTLAPPGRCDRRHRVPGRSGHGDRLPVHGSRRRGRLGHLHDRPSRGNRRHDRARLRRDRVWGGAGQGAVHRLVGAGHRQRHGGDAADRSRQPRARGADRAAGGDLADARAFRAIGPARAARAADAESAHDGGRTPPADRTVRPGAARGRDRRAAGHDLPAPARHPAAGSRAGNFNTAITAAGQLLWLEDHAADAMRPARAGARPRRA